MASGLPAETAAEAASTCKAAPVRMVAQPASPRTPVSSSSSSPSSSPPASSSLPAALIYKATAKAKAAAGKQAAGRPPNTARAIQALQQQGTNPHRTCVRANCGPIFLAPTFLTGHLLFHANSTFLYRLSRFQNRLFILRPLVSGVTQLWFSTMSQRSEGGEEKASGKAHGSPHQRHSVSTASKFSHKCVSPRSPFR